MFFCEHSFISIDKIGRQRLLYMWLYMQELPVFHGDCTSLHTFRQYSKHSGNLLFWMLNLPCINSRNNVIYGEHSFFFRESGISAWPASSKIPTLVSYESMEDNMLGKSSQLVAGGVNILCDSMGNSLLVLFSFFSCVFFFACFVSFYWHMFYPLIWLWVFLMNLLPWDVPRDLWHRYTKDITFFWSSSYMCMWV